jgi:hypothetical protein
VGWEVLDFRGIIVAGKYCNSEDDSGTLGLGDLETWGLRDSEIRGQDQNYFLS